MESFWILGAGHFGSLAVKRILQGKGHCNLIVVDRDARPLDDLKEKPLNVVKQEAVHFLSAQHGTGDEWIVPAIPEHVAFCWLRQQLNKAGTVTALVAPLVLDQQIPNPIRTKEGVLYTSFATFRCPDDCDELEEMCSVTRKRRQANLFELIQNIKVPGYKTLVVRSRQLAPGVGGYQLSTLWRLLEAVKSSRKNILVATACRCHGVINALRFHRKAHSP
jgi:hypothetical protein